MVSSDDYRDLLRDLHDSEVSFGVGGQHALVISQICKSLQIGSVTDYGAGKRGLEKVLREEFALKLDYFPYDVAFPEYGRPVPADLVCCIEVLEHVEPEFIDQVIGELAQITIKWGYFTVHCADAGKFLADGRNAHILQRPISWWLTKFSQHFDVQWMSKTGLDSFAVLVTKSENRHLRVSGLDFYQRDSVKHHVKACLAALRLEIGRRIRRRHWRPE